MPQKIYSKCVEMVVFIIVTLTKELIMKAPFSHCGIVKESIMIDSEIGITYDLEDGRSVHCPKQGGVWVHDRQVSGTCDSPYRYIEEAILLIT